MSVLCVCVCRQLFSPFQVLLQVSLPKDFSDTKQKKSNDIGKGWASTVVEVTGFLCSELLPMVKKPITRHFDKSPNGSYSREGNRVGWGQKKIPELFFLSTSRSVADLSSLERNDTIVCVRECSCLYTDTVDYAPSFKISSANGEIIYFVLLEQMTKRIRWKFCQNRIGSEGIKSADNTVKSKQTFWTYLLTTATPRPCWLLWVARNVGWKSHLALHTKSFIFQK